MEGIYGAHGFRERMRKERSKREREEQSKKNEAEESLKQKRREWEKRERIYGPRRKGGWVRGHVRPLSYTSGFTAEMEQRLNVIEAQLDALEDGTPEPEALRQELDYLVSQAGTLIPHRNVTPAHASRFDQREIASFMDALGKFGEQSPEAAELALGWLHDWTVDEKLHSSQRSHLRTVFDVDRAQFVDSAMRRIGSVKFATRLKEMFWLDVIGERRVLVRPDEILNEPDVPFRNPYAGLVETQNEVDAVAALRPRVVTSYYNPDQRNPFIRYPTSRPLYNSLVGEWMPIRDEVKPDTRPFISEQGETGDLPVDTWSNFQVFK